MPPKQWDAEQSVNPQLAIQLIETQFPALALVSLELIGEGWDNTAYLVNKKLVFRFPRRQISVDLINIESSLLPSLVNKLPLPIPCPIYVSLPPLKKGGQGGFEYPWPFSGYKILDGQTACQAHLTREERSKLAKPLAEFLKALHQIKAGAPDDHLRRLDVEMRWPKAHANLTQIEKLGLLPDMKPLFELLESLKHIRNTSGHKVLCHGDLYARHLLISPKRELCGVIDWGDAHLGNPAVDLSIVYSFLPPSARPSFWETYGTPDFNTQKLAEFRALFSASQIAVYAHDTGDTDLLVEGLEALKFLTEDTADLYMKLLKYEPKAEPEISFKAQMLELLKNNPNCFERSSTNAHFTASCWLLNKSGDKALLMHHRKLDDWFQLGGHADGDPNLLRTALKEAQEESGLTHIIAVQNGIFDIDIHRIPANSKDAAHEHYDVRFLLQVADDSEVQQNHESKELRWIGKNPKELPTQSESVVRMFWKWLD